MKTTIDDEWVWLERIETSKIVGICVLDEQGRLVQRFDDDPELRSTLVEHQQQRIREMEHSSNFQQTPPVAYPVRESTDWGYHDPGEELSAAEAEALFPADGSGGQAGDDAAFADLARRLSRPGSRAYQAPTQIPRDNG